MLPGHPDRGQRDPGGPVRHRLLGWCHHSHPSGVPRPLFPPAFSPSSHQPGAPSIPRPRSAWQTTRLPDSPPRPACGPLRTWLSPPLISPQAQHSPQGAWGHRSGWETGQPPAPRPGWARSGRAYRSHPGDPGGEATWPGSGFWGGGFWKSKREQSLQTLPASTSEIQEVPLPPTSLHRCGRDGGHCALA